MHVGLLERFGYTKWNRTLSNIHANTITTMSAVKKFYSLFQPILNQTHHRFFNTSSDIVADVTITPLEHTCNAVKQLQFVIGLDAKTIWVEDKTKFGVTIATLCYVHHMT